MQVRSLHQVSVWLDDLSTAEGAFPEAMDWAIRLNLPLRAVVTSTRYASHAWNHDRRQVNGGAANEREPAPVLEKIRAWGSACAQRGVTMETSFWVGETDVGIDQFLRPWSLCVFEEARADPVREKLLARSARNPELLLLLAPPIHRPMARVLIVSHRGEGPNLTFLETAARLCLALDVQPLILTLASSERQARLQQSFAEGVFSSLHLRADFDSVIALDFCAAVGRVAAWRHCSHVIAQRPRNTSLWQRLRRDAFWQQVRGDFFSELTALSRSLSLLGLPDSVALELPPKIHDNRGEHPPADFSPIPTRLA